MTNKLLLVQWPPTPGDEADLFKQFGYHVTRTDILFLDDIADIDAALKAAGLSLGDFDVVILAVAGGPSPAGDAHAFAEESVRQLKNKISNFESELGKRIVLIGNNWGLSHAVEVSQSRLFDGFFLGKEVPFEKIPLMLQGKPYFVT